MGIVQILGIGIIAAIFSIIIKQEKPEFAVLVSIATGIIIFFVIADKIPYVIDTFNNIISKTQVNMVFISTLIKIIGIAYITSSVPRYARIWGRQYSLKDRVGEKIIIMVLGLPILTALTETILGILS